jgi:hypothetical protein
MKGIAAVLLALLVASTIAADDRLYVRSNQNIGMVQGAIVTAEHREYYEGFTRLTEPEFMRISGYESPAATQFHEKNRSLWTRTWVWIGVGAGLVLIATPIVGLASPSTDVWLVPAYGSVAALSMSLVPLFRLLVRGEYYLSMHQAELMASEYNASIE